LKAILDILGLTCTSDNSIEAIKHRMGMLLERYKALAVIVTRGDQGTIVLKSD
jgi:hypothetical protein